MFEDDLEALSTVDLLESAADHRAEVNRLEARLLRHAQIFADRNHPSCADTGGADDPSVSGRERGIVLGGEGCPEIAEFAPAEFGALLGISPGAAAAYIGNALALRHRFPHVWAKVLGGEATPWRACKIAAACVELSEDAAASIDQRLARIVDRVTPIRLEKIVKAAEAHAAPEVARAKAEQRARERGVFVGHSDDYGSKKIFVQAPSGHVIRFNATIASIADALKLLGDSRPVQARRAEAIGIISDPAYTEELLLQARHQHLNNLNAAADTSPGLAAGTSTPTDDLGPTDGSGYSDDADRDPVHPSEADLVDPLDPPYADPVEPFDPALGAALGADADSDGRPLDAAARRALHARLIQIKHDAYAHRSGGDTSAGAGAQPGAASSAQGLRPGGTEIYVHLTEHTLATGTGVLRAETLGPLLAEQLTELVGHAPYTVKPVIDLNQPDSVDAYEIPDRIRERVKLIYPVEVFPYGNRETTNSTDLDHIQPYDPLGPPEQTSTTNLAPLGRFNHRIKTHARGWRVHRLDPTTIEWTTPHGFTYHVTPTGTTRANRPRGRP